MDKVYEIINALNHLKTNLHMDIEDVFPRLISAVDDSKDALRELQDLEEQQEQQAEDIESLKGEVEGLESTNEEQAATIQTMGDEIEELTGRIAELEHEQALLANQLKGAGWNATE